MNNEDSSFKNLFLPFTSKKAVFWIILLGFLVFFNSLFGLPIWDDNVYIFSNQSLSNFNFFYLFGQNVYNVGQYYRPLTAAYFSFLLNLFGNTYFFYHLIQLLMHIANTVLVFIFLKKLLKKEFAFFAALLFLVHPFQVESVAWISGSIVPFSFLFGISGLLLLTRKKLTYKALSLSAFLFLLSILSRETGIFFVALAVFYKLLFRKDGTLRVFIYGVVLSVVYLLIRLSFHITSLSANYPYPIDRLDFAQRLINIPLITLYYVRNLFIPDALATDQQWVVRSINLPYFFIPLIFDFVFFALIAAAGFFIYRKAEENIKKYFFFLIWFLLGFGILFQIVPLDMTVADRWMYFPLVGLLGILGLFAQTFSNKFKLHENKVFLIFILMAVFFSVFTLVRNSQWNNSITLFSNDIKINNNFDVENQLGAELAIQGRYKEALPILLDSHKKNLEDSNIFDIAGCYKQLGNIKLAEKYYEEIIINKDNIKIRPVVKQNTYNEMAKLLILHEDPEVNAVFLKRAVKEYTANSTFWAFYAITEYNLGNKPEALAFAKNAYGLNPNNSTNQLLQNIKANKAAQLKLLN